MFFKSDVGRKELKELMSENNLIDVWREMNGGKYNFQEGK